MSEQEEKLPVHESIKVLKYTTLYKTNKWWEAIVLGEQTFGDKTYKKVHWFLWAKDNKTGKWKRKQKKTINFPKNWNDAKPIIDEYMLEVGA